MTQRKRVKIPSLKITPHKTGTLIRFRLTLDGIQKEYRLVLSLSYNNKRDRRKAEMIADRIRDDIADDLHGLRPGAFDRSLDRYRFGENKPQAEQKSTMPKEVKTLIEVWLQFVQFKVKEGKIQETTLNRVYSNTEKVLERVQRENPDLLKPDNATKFLDYLTDHYKPSTLVLYYKNWSACANWAVKRDIWNKNPYSRGLSELKSQCNPVKSGKSYSDKESIVILEAVRTDRFTSPHAAVKHSYYYEFLKFLFLTGERPQLAIALDWNQIVWEQGRPTMIYFDRAYSDAILKPSKGNRNGKNTPLIFPVNDELADLILAIPKRENKHREPTISKHLARLKRPYYPDLVFPSPRGWYIDIGNFTNRIFSTVVKKLVELGEVEEYLSTYHSRHTVQNRWLESGMSEEDVATLHDTSPEMIRKHYRDDYRYRKSIAQKITLPTLDKDDTA